VYCAGGNDHAQERRCCVIQGLVLELQANQIGWFALHLESGSKTRFPTRD